MEYIKFIVDGQRLNYNSRCYVSTDTIDTLFCRFRFEIDGSGNARGGWSLPYLWAQFHDEKGNTYVKPVKDNVCSIPSECLRQPEFKMTLFATDTEDYMVCKKRYTTNEVSFKFKGLANLNYDGGVDPDEPPHTHWEIILERVVACEDKIKTCENTADKLSQDMSAMGDKVDNMSQDVSTMGDKVDGFDGRIADNANAIEKANTNVEELNVGLGAESKAREDADARLEGLIGDRYTKAETDALVDAKQDKLDDEQLEALNNGLTSDDKETLDTLDETINDWRDIGDISTLLKTMNGMGAGFHSSIYRAGYLGDTLTDEQKLAITYGAFDDMFVGDYWIINGVNWVIADFDYYYNVGNADGQGGFTQHHIVVVPDTILYDAQMNSTDHTSGAYTMSDMCTMNLNDAKSAFYNAFGEAAVASHFGLYANATNSDGAPSGYEWKDMRVDLMSEEQVYGHTVCGTGNKYDVGTQKTQFKLFTFDQTKINIGQTYWLTNVASSDSFAVVGDDGCASNSKASASCGVRPFACIVGLIGGV